jgi:peroxiredoxin
MDKRFAAAVTMIATLPLLLSDHRTLAAPPASTVQDFSLQDYRGKSHRLSDYQESKVVVLAFLGTGCPLVKLYGPKLEQVSQKYQPRGVTILGMNANRQDSITNIAAYARRQQITFPILKDVGNTVADAVQAERTPSVIVLNSDRVIVYRGRIDDQYGVGYAREEPKHAYLTDAIEAALADKHPAVASVAAEGCLIGRMRKPDADSSVTYGAHIAPILVKHCAECHREGEIAPFALTSYDEVAGWADMIREVVADQRMPPWHADPAHGKFSNARGLSAAEKDLINKWVLAGAPAGDLSQLPALPPKAEGWQLNSAPDLVVQMNESFRVPADGVVKYKYFEVDPGLTEDKWVRAAEVIPGSREVVHHVLVFARDGKSRKNSGAGGGSFLTAYVPGLRAVEIPTGMAKLVPAGSKIIFQMHYTPIGEERTDRSSVGLYFADEKDVNHVVVTQETRSHDFAIPPRDSNYKVEATSPRAPIPLKILAMMPHMHLRGKSFRYEAILPDGQRRTLLDVPAYDFNWQTSYRPETLLELPAGARMHCVAHFDNSANNLNNPDPDATVGWGDQTWNEMMIGYFDVAYPRSRDDGDSVEVLALMKQFDKNEDGKIQRSEVPKKLHPVFTQLDTNNNDEVTLQELRKLPGAR